MSPSTGLWINTTTTTRLLPKQIKCAITWARMSRTLQRLAKRQHRRHYFTFSVSGKWIRFIRWDRAGAVVSERFNILKHSELFCQFFWRFAHITDAERGYDLTVEPATPEQEETFRQAIQDHIRAQLSSHSPPSDLQAAVGEHYQRGAVSVIHLPHSSYSQLPDLRGHHLLVSRPIAVPLSVAGRGTRAYWAVDSRTYRKDSAFEGYMALRHDPCHRPGGATGVEVRARG
ncbi:hypothetical protein BD309DRAFT_489840 [Dichomitus squalens]|uniref:Fungal-type protein kinase domain-containing protein n=1 Tax=Dichomitus squalens TaxID=114155 RepID=A0A4Q9NGQ4_9APHY|nr:hypothetical protein BD309DRAFT_489840 [Dichomitus squalens]TBU60667.1 hypothetical protein BD310DRAFT_310163 [Dichomitus squalens]